MMYKFFTFLLVLASSLTYLRAEEDVNVIEIRYKVFIENKDSLSSFYYNLPYETFHIVSPDFVLTKNKYATEVDEIHIYDLANMVEYQCYFKDENQNIAVKNPSFQIPTLVTNTKDDRIYQIGGMRCKKFEILHKNKPVEIYTTDVFGVDFTPFSELEGYAMQYSFVDDVYGKVTYVAASIFPTKLSKSIFSLDGFKITDKIFPEDLRSSFQETLVSKESKSLFKLNKKKIGYKFKLTDKRPITEESDPNSLVVMTICDFHKMNSTELDLMKNLIKSMQNKNVNFYCFVAKHLYSNTDIDRLQSAGFKVAYLKDLFLSKFKVDFFPTYILIDKDRKVIKYKIGTDADMLSSFSKKIIELSDD